MEGPSIEPYRKIDGRQIVIAAIGTLELPTETLAGTILRPSRDTFNLFD